MRRRFAPIAALATALCAIPVALAGSGADPGVSSTTILIGGTSPLTGPAASYATVARGAQAYFDFINAKGGAAKRKIEYRVVDDAYNPAQTVQAVRRLVEQDNVFAVFNTLGTEANLAIRDYLNQVKVPQLFVASGATTWGRDAAKYPWTIGFQPSYAAEGLVYGQYIAKTQKKAKVGVLFQNDDYGKDLLASLKSGLSRSGSKVVAAEPYQVTSPDVGSQIGKLKASGANVLAIFATPTFAIQAYVFANRLGWRPLIINNAVSATSNTMTLASEGGKNKSIEGTISTTPLKDPLNPRWKKDPGMKQYRAILAKYAKGANPNDANHLYGMAVAYETVGLLKGLGANPTRAGLMARARSIASAKNPFLLPGVSVKTGKGDNFPLQQGQLQRWMKGRWVPFGGLWTSKRN
ncbi:MAG: ABC transporter substrate-binding protein [Thermoleophilia bacterium]|nr:ABC transporter substrate-binding protein [Thermoleophilia bacterium]MDH4338949.1 ABC transporter substrate-binding protein [Thermoleophilia bacterium]MDH5279976.1 ABC transporter substrate-binding protein [Thermoleophilia bacterium]